MLGSNRPVTGVFTKYILCGYVPTYTSIIHNRIIEAPGGQWAVRINTAQNILSYHYSGSTILDFFLSISLQKSRSPVMAAQCSMYWHGGGVVFVFSPAGIRGNTVPSSEIFTEIIVCSDHQIYYRNRIPWCKQNHLPTIKGKTSNCITLLQFFYFFTK